MYPPGKTAPHLVYSLYKLSIAFFIARRYFPKDKRKTAAVERQGCG
jgi:hypothetical protein